MDSPFLALPPELRDQVYNLVLGRRIVHVQSETFLRFKVIGSSREVFSRRAYPEHQVETVRMEEMYTDTLSFGRCYESMDEQHAYDVFQQVRLDDPYGLRPKCKGPIKDCRYCKRHRNCWGRGDGRQVVDIADLPLFLLSCQIHREAKAALYRNTTFSFNLAYTMTRFVQSLNPERRHQIRSIHIEMSRDDKSSSWSWDKDIVPDTMKMLTGLTTLHVNIRPVYLRPSAPRDHQTVTTGLLTSYHECANMLQRGTLSWWKNDLALFRHEKLQCVTVILEDDSPCIGYTSNWNFRDLEMAMRKSGDWTIAERAELARLLGEKLLASWNAISADAEIANSAQYPRLLADGTWAE